MTKSILSQLSIIMTSSFDILSPPRIRGGKRVSRGGIESGQVRGSAGGLEKLSAGVSGLVKKRLDCTVLLFLRFGSSNDISTIKIGENSVFVTKNINSSLIMFNLS